MKRFLLFAFNDYYPGGGMEDFMGDFDTMEECQKESKKYSHLKDSMGCIDYDVEYKEKMASGEYIRRDNIQIYDTVTKQTISNGKIYEHNAQNQ